MTKAVFFDIDGTLIDTANKRTKMTEPVFKAVAALKAAGHYTFIATGRPWAYLDKELTTSGLFDGFVLMNGAVVLLNGKVIYHKYLAKELVKKIVQFAEKNNLEYVLEGYPYVYLKPNYQALEQVYTDIDISLDNFVRDYDLAAINVSKMEFLAQNPSEAGVLRKLLALEGVTGLIDPNLVKYMELYSADISKGTGLLAALKALNISINDSYALGDGLNDLEMMDIVGHSLVMGNAGSVLKTKAEHILPTVEHDGVAEGIHRYILKDC